GIRDLRMSRGLGDVYKRQLPALRDGLSLSERLTLEIVRDSERPSAGQVFAELTARREPLPYLGDLMFRVLLRALLEEPGALLRTPAPEPVSYTHLRAHETC
ncbi:hypothetical protein KZ843_39450, partial [Pseudomonas aeruginosa]|nr:hypothetical protein [Pseudomonas aeruginosa]